MILPTEDPLDLLVQVGAGFGVLLPDPQWGSMCEALHSKQRAFVVDPSKRKCALAGRRGGKSFGIIYWLIEHWRSFPGKTSLFIAQTRDHAREILWEDLKAVCRKWGLKVRYNETRLEARFENGHKVRLRGCENLKMAEKNRGPHYWRVCIDEAHIFPDALLRHLINRVIDPALMDLKGELALCGTPGYDEIGLWYEATCRGRTATEDTVTSWSLHTWNCLDNTFIDGAAYIEEKKCENNWSDDNPELIREYYGRWVKDPNALVYQFDPDRHLYWDAEWELTPIGLKTVIGVDIGWSDGCGFTVAQKRAGAQKIRIPVSFSEVGLTDPKIAAVIKKLMRDFKTRNIFIDTKGNRITAETMRSYGIPAEPAPGDAASPNRKRPKIEYLRGLMSDDQLEMHPEHAMQLAGEMQTLPWELKDGVKVGHKEGYIDECCDSAQSAVIGLSQTSIQAEDKPAPGTPEHELALEKKARREAAQRGQARNPNRWGKRSRANA